MRKGCPLQGKQLFSCRHLFVLRMSVRPSAPLECLPDFTFAEAATAVISCTAAAEKGAARPRSPAAGAGATAVAMTPAAPPRPGPSPAVTASQAGQNSASSNIGTASGSTLNCRRISTSGTWAMARWLSRLKSPVHWEPRRSASASSSAAPGRSRAPRLPSMPRYGSPPPP